MTADAAGKTWTYTFPSNQTWTTEGYWEFRYTATSPAGEIDVAAESVWIAATPESFITVRDLTVSAPNVVATQVRTSPVQNYKSLCSVTLNWTATRSATNDTITQYYGWRTYTGGGDATVDAVAASGAATPLPIWSSSPGGLSGSFNGTIPNDQQMPGTYVLFYVYAVNNVTGDTDTTTIQVPLGYGSAACS